MISKRKPYIVAVGDATNRGVRVIFNTRETIEFEVRPSSSTANARGISLSHVEALISSIKQFLKENAYNIFPEAYEMVDLDEAVKNDPELGRVIKTYQVVGNYDSSKALSSKEPCKHE